MSGGFGRPAAGENRERAAGGRTVVCVNLNAAIDRTYDLPAFEAGGVWRVRGVRDAAGGKGANVARVLRQLGYASRMIGFAGGRNGAFIREELTRQGIGHAMIEADGESRVCLNIVAGAARVSTELLEPGPVIAERRQAELRELLRREAAEAALVVMSGSLPRGVPADFYRELIADVGEAGVPVILDTSGEALREGLKARPWLVKPNEDELAALLGAGTAAGEDGWAAGVKALLDGGVRHAVLSLGERGALAGSAAKSGGAYGTSAVGALAVGAAGEAAAYGASAGGARDGAGDAAAVGADSAPAGGAGKAAADGGVEADGASAVGAAYFRVHAARVTPVSTVGCGDAFTAGLAGALVRGLGLAEALRHGAAAGAANALTETAGQVEREAFERLLAEVRVEPAAPYR